MVPLKGVKVGVRNVDPDKDVEELKSKIRDHPELNLTGYMLSEFSLRRKGGMELPVGSLVSLLMNILTNFIFSIITLTQNMYHNAWLLAMKLS